MGSGLHAITDPQGATIDREFTIGCAAGVEHGSKMIGEHRLAALHGGEMQQPDINPARLVRI
jgi:hypothetical protein